MAAEADGQVGMGELHGQTAGARRRRRGGGQEGNHRDTGAPWPKLRNSGKTLARCGWVVGGGGGEEEEGAGEDKEEGAGTRLRRHDVVLVTCSRYTP